MLGDVLYVHKKLGLDEAPDGKTTTLTEAQWPTVRTWRACGIADFGGNKKDADFSANPDPKSGGEKSTPFIKKNIAKWWVDVKDIKSSKYYEEDLTTVEATEKGADFSASPDAKPGGEKSTPFIKKNIAK